MAPPAEFVDDHRIGVLGWLPVLTVVIFLFMGNIGYGTLIWVVTGISTSSKYLPVDFGLCAHREFLIRNGVGKTCLWKKYILNYESGEN